MAEEPLRAIIIGDYTTKTGLGTAINIPMRKLAREGVITPIMLGTGFSGWNVFLDDEYDSYPILPMISLNGKHPDIFGKDCLHGALAAYEKKYNAPIDLVILCNDVQHQHYVALPEQALQKGDIPSEAVPIFSKYYRTFRHLAYFPIDGLCKDETFHPHLKPIIREMDYPVCICNWIKDAIKKDIGIEPDMIYHGVDTKIFKPVNKKEARKKLNLYQFGLSEDAFVVGMIGTNQNRKKFEDFIPAMAELIKQRGNVYFFCFTEYKSRYQGNHDLLQLMAQYGINERCIDTRKYLGCPDEGSEETVGMTDIYGMADVTVLLSIGEGFGIPPLYSRSMGIPCLVTDCTAMSELCADDFERIPVKWWYHGSGINLVRYITDTDELVKRLIRLYDNREMIKKLGEKCREMACEVFDYDTVIIPQWAKLLERVKKDLRDNPPPGRRGIRPENVDDILQWKNKSLNIVRRYETPVGVDSAETGFETDLEPEPDVSTVKVKSK